MQSKLYQDYDALAYKPHNLGEERGAINHIKKAKQKTKGLEIVFDPKRHKEFVTGFRKRKQQRRKVANQQLEKKAKQQRVESRAERRKEMKHQLGLPEDYGIPDSDGEQGGGIDEEAAAAAAAKAEVKQYQQAGFMTTVSITNFNAGYNDSSDDEGPADAAGSDDADDAAGDTAAAQHTARQQQQNPKKQHKKQQPGQQQRSKGSKSGGTKHGKVAKKKKHR